MSATTENNNSEDKVSALMKMFEEEKARHRQAEMAAETRIRLLESKLKQVEQKSSSATTPIRRINSKPTTTTTPRRTTTTTTTTPNKSKTRETVTSTEPRTSDSLYATPTKRKTFLPNTSTGTAADSSASPARGLNNNNSNNSNKRVPGSPEGSPSNVASLPRASSAATSRSERLAAARAKRKEEVQQRTSTPNTTSSAKAATPIKGRTRSFTPTSSKKTSSTKNNNKTWAGVNPEHEKSWKKFCELAKGQFSSQELVAVSSETLQQLMDHFSVTDPIERARIEAHWSYLNEKGSTLSTSQRQQQQQQQKTPHRKRVTELHFPDHPDDFNLRTTVPFDPAFTPRKLVGPDAREGPRGCNIESHQFTCPERKMRSLTLLRPRSPATSNFADSALEQAASSSPANAKHRSKKMIDCDAKLTNRTDEKIHSKKFYETVPGQESHEKAEGKRRASAIPGTKVRSNADGDQSHHSSSKKMNVPKPKTDDDDSRRGIKIHVQDPTQSRDAKRYTKQAEYASTIRTAADSTLSTVTLEKLVASSSTMKKDNTSSNKVAAPRSLRVNNNSQPTKFQLKTPFAVD